MLFTIRGLMLGCLSLGMVTTTLPAIAAAPAPDRNIVSPAETALVAAEEARFQALISQNIDQIAAGMTDEVMFGHLTGIRVDKNHFLDDIRSGKLPYKSIVAKDRVARVFGEVGITRGVVDMVVGERHLSDSYLAVYVKREGRWQLLDWQSAAPPPKPGERPWLPPQAAPASSGTPPQS